MVVTTSAVDPADRTHPARLPIGCFYLDLRNILLDSSLKSLLMILKRLIGLGWAEEDHATAVLKAGYTHASFYRLGKDISFKQRWNNFARVGGNRGLIFLFIAISSVSVVSLASRLLKILDISPVETEIVFKDTWEFGVGVALVI